MYIGFKCVARRLLLCILTLRVFCPICCYLFWCYLCFALFAAIYIGFKVLCAVYCYLHVFSGYLTPFAAMYGGFKYVCVAPLAAIAMGFIDL